MKPTDESLQIFSYLLSCLFLLSSKVIALLRPFFFKRAFKAFFTEDKCQCAAQPQPIFS